MSILIKELENIESLIAGTGTGAMRYEERLSRAADSIEARSVLYHLKHIPKLDYLIALLRYSRERGSLGKAAATRPAVQQGYERAMKSLRSFKERALFIADFFSMYSICREPIRDEGLESRAERIYYAAAGTDRSRQQSRWDTRLACIAENLEEIASSGEGARDLTQGSYERVVYAHMLLEKSRYLAHKAKEEHGTASMLEKIDEQFNTLAEQRYKQRRQEPEQSLEKELPSAGHTLAEPALAEPHAGSRIAQEEEAEPEPQRELQLEAEREPQPSLQSLITSRTSRRSGRPGILARAWSRIRPYAKAGVLGLGMLVSPVSGNATYDLSNAFSNRLSSKHSLFYSAPQKITIPNTIPNTATDIVLSEPELPEPAFRQHGGVVHRQVAYPAALDSLTYEHDHALLVDKATQHAMLYQQRHNGWQLIRTMPVSTGINAGNKGRSGDHKTPEGTFTVTELCRSSNWVSPYNNSLGAYGSYFVRLNCGDWTERGMHLLSAKSPIGIHGTNEPYKLGSRASMGCVRFANDVLKQLVEENYLAAGTAVIIGESIEHLTAGATGKSTTFNYADAYYSSHGSNDQGQQRSSGSQSNRQQEHGQEHDKGIAGLEGAQREKLQGRLWTRPHYSRV